MPRSSLESIPLTAPTHEISSTTSHSAIVTGARCSASSASGASRPWAGASPTSWPRSRACGPRSNGAAPRFEAALGFEEGRAALDRNADALFGPRPPERVPRIMVTLPSEAAGDYDLVAHLLGQGMDIARINGAHDDPEAWARMVGNVRKAASEVGRPCRISMDLPGPKLRTCALAPGPQVVKLRPARSARRPYEPAAVTLGGCAAPPSRDAGAVVPVDPTWLGRRHRGDVIALVDTRGSRRQLRVVDAAPGTCVVEAWDTTYLEAGATLSCDDDTTLVGPLRPVAQSHLLRIGDPLVLTRDPGPWTAWRHGQPGCARIGCSLPAVFGAAHVGQRVVLDDGRLTAVIERVTPDEIGLRILTASPSGSGLHAEKGINLPDTELLPRRGDGHGSAAARARRRAGRHGRALVPAPRA